jgi:hypothetical protein
LSLYRKLARKPKQFLSVTGMTLTDFQRLLPQFAQANQELERRRKACVVRTKQARQRCAGGGAKFANDLPDRLLMLLLYYRLYLTQEFLTLLFRAADKSLICRNIQLMRPVFETVLPVPARARARILSLAKKEQARRRKRIGTGEEFREASSSPSASPKTRPSARATTPARSGGTRASSSSSARRRASSLIKARRSGVAPTTSKSSGRTMRPAPSAPSLKTTG